MKCTLSLLVLWWHKHWGVFLLSCYTITPDMVFITVMASFHEMYLVSPHVLWWHKHWSVFLLSCHTIKPGPVFCLLVGVSSDYTQPITGQVTEVTCPVISQAQPELTQSKRQKTGPDMIFITVMASFHEMYLVPPRVLWWHLFDLDMTL